MAEVLGIHATFLLNAKNAQPSLATSSNVIDDIYCSASGSSCASSMMPISTSK
jgi:uncharacterized protein YfaQ (DUF2300 family)